MFSTGYYTLFRYRGVPVRFHWTAPLGAFIFSGFRFVPGFWLGFLMLIVIHEMGHAFLVRQRRLRSLEIMVHGFGGYCRHEVGSAYDGAIIAWGGVLAQLLVLGLPTVILIQLGLWPQTAFGAELASALTRTNLVLAALNLIPFGGLDGQKAWQLPKMWWRRRKGAAKSKANAKAKSHLSVVTKTGESPEEMARRIAAEALDQGRRRH
ncbi:MAG: stage IV sporulation protein FB [Polyangiales bacterium]|jgi:stage IV sporulation protein FB